MARLLFCSQHLFRCLCKPISPKEPKKCRDGNLSKTTIPFWSAFHYITYPRWSLYPPFPPSPQSTTIICSVYDVLAFGQHFAQAVEPASQDMTSRISANKKKKAPLKKFKQKKTKIQNIGIKKPTGKKTTHFCKGSSDHRPIPQNRETSKAGRRGGRKGGGGSLASLYIYSPAPPPPKIHIFLGFQR